MKSRLYLLSLYGMVPDQQPGLLGSKWVRYGHVTGPSYGRTYFKFLLCCFKGIVIE